MAIFKVLPRRFPTSDHADQTLVLASAVTIFMYRCKRLKREEETSACKCTSVAMLQPSSQAFLIRHNKHLFLIFGCRRWSTRVARDEQPATPKCSWLLPRRRCSPYSPCGQQNYAPSHKTLRGRLTRNETRPPDFILSHQWQARLLNFLLINIPF
jgi:hypothetical protein